MISKSPFKKQDKCAIAKEKLKQTYIKEGKEKEFDSEIKEMSCVDGKWQSSLKGEQNAPKVIKDNKKSIIEK